MIYVYDDDNIHPFFLASFLLSVKWMNAISLIGGGGGRCMFVGTEFEGGRGSVVDTTRRRCVGVCTSCGGKEGCEVIMS